MAKRPKKESINYGSLVLLAVIVALAGVLIGLFFGNLHKKGNAGKTAVSAQTVSTTQEAPAQEGVTIRGAARASVAHAGNAEGVKAPQTAAGQENQAAQTAAAQQAVPTETVTPSPAPSPTVTPATGKVICIDPGHELMEILEEEPNGPGSDVMKQGVTSGAYGEASGKNEYEVVLEIGLKLRDILTSKGYTVVMTRETHEVTLSNVQRAQIATDANADAFVRIHCNGVDDPTVAGVMCYGPSGANPYLSAELITNSQKLCELLRDNQCAVTGQRPMENLYQDDMTGINWATMPVSIVEVGFMSNPEEDLYIASEEGENAIATGLANGIDAYFAG